MAREYRTIEEVAGPLMLVRGVENVKFDELAEIELPNGEVRHCKVLEIDGTDALVSYLKVQSASMSMNQRSFSGAGQNLLFPAICSAASLTAWVVRSTAVP